MAETRPPKVFISYAWEDDLKTWVLDFATRLRLDGINAILDQWETVPGDQLPEFMEKSVRESDFVLFICTPTYKRKSDRRKGGVGYEGHIITGEVFQKNNHRKFIPVLRKGKWVTASPSWATSKLFVDFRGEPYSETSYQQLLNTLFGKSPTAPPLRDDVFREKIERDAVEWAEHERLEREANDKAVQDEAENDAKEKARLEDEKKAKQIAAKEKERIKKEDVEKRRLPYYETPPSGKRETNAKGDVVGEISDSLIVTGSGNIINVGNQKKNETEKPQSKKVKPSRKQNTAIIVAVIGLVGTIIAALLISPLIEKLLSPAPSATESAIVTLTSRPTTPTQSVESSQAPAESFTSTSTPLPTEIIDAKGVSMVLVPAGEFIMGNNNENDNQKPVHRVYLESFYIDKYEVTNALYEICLDVSVCSPLKSESSNTRPNYYGNTQYKDYPVVYVDWFQAKTYCEWRGARLPTEAEWEKAARGTDGRTYPWGENINCTRANYNNCRGDTTQVGIYESGKSVYEIYDLAGNVWEWVGSAYEEYPYVASDGREKFNNQSIWIQRGGSWNFGSVETMTTFRGWNYVSNATDRTGFRCAHSVP